MAIKLGKRVQGLGAKDIAAHSIWIECFEDARHGEDCVAPVLSKTENVTKEMIKKYVSVLVVFRVKGTDLLGIGDFRDFDRFTAEWVMVGAKQTPLTKVKGLKAPVTIQAIPKLFGKSDVQFRIKKLDERDAILVK